MRGGEPLHHVPGHNLVTFVTIGIGVESATINKVSARLCRMLSHGSFDRKAGATEHASARGNSGERHQPGPEAAVWGSVPVADRERTGMRVSQLRRVAGRNTDHAQWIGGRGKCNRASGE